MLALMKQNSRHRPMDFSTWDCYKTGVGSPAIVCDLTHKPTEEKCATFVTSEKEQEERSRLEQVANDYLMQLNPADVLRCVRTRGTER